MSADAGASDSAFAADGGLRLERLSAIDAAAPLSIVELALFSLRPELNACYRTAAKTNPTLEGQAVLAVTIGADGHVTDVATISQTGLDPALMDCATAALRTGIFQRPDGGRSVVNVPLSFRPPAARADAGR